MNRLAFAMSESCMAANLMSLGLSLHRYKMVSVYRSLILLGDNDIGVFVTVKSYAKMEGGISIIVIIINSIDNHQFLFSIFQAQECGRV